MAPAKRLAAAAKGVADRSIKRTRWPRRASITACHRPVMPAPTTVILRCAIGLPSIAARHAFAARIGAALQLPVLAQHDHVRAGIEQVDADPVAVGFQLQRMPEG